MNEMPIEGEMNECMSGYSIVYKTQPLLFDESTFKLLSKLLTSINFSLMDSLYSTTIHFLHLHHLPPLHHQLDDNYPQVSNNHIV